MPHKPRPSAPKRKLTDQARRRIFLDKFAAVGLMTPSADAACLPLKTIAEWLKHDRDFREAFDEAKLRFHDHLEETIVSRIDGIDQRKNETLLRFKIQGELPEKYGRPGKKPKEKDHHCFTWDDLERIVQEANDENSS